MSPMQRKDYSTKWHIISRAIRFGRAKGRCEGTPKRPLCAARNGEPHPETGSIVVLTVAHMDHDRTNNHPRNLRALCQRCHLEHDREQHLAASARTRRNKKKIESLFQEEER